ncbi:MULTISPECIES: hypothetical protein [Lysinibacillus]|nr:MULTISPECIES: hypothetical protein [Lysinibacillus]
MDLQIGKKIKFTVEDVDGGAIISVSHDRRYLKEVASTIYELTSEGLTKK